jgi:SAM-dependent methyltransferase
MRDNKSYYDTFSQTYDHGRDAGYHAFLDEAEVALVTPHLVGGKSVLEVGCGTGLILERLGRAADRAVGVDLSPGMLEKARSRGLEVHEASATALPFEDASFDVACSFKVLAHVEQIETAMAEMARVVRPGGRIVAEFYNTSSLRALVKRLGPSGAIGSGGDTDESDVFTRFDSIGDIEGYLPPTLTVERVDGIRVITPMAAFFRVPGWAGVERLAMKTPLRHLGGFLVVTLARSVG